MMAKRGDAGSAPGDITIILSINDLEAHAIRQMGEGQGATVIDLGLGWGQASSSATSKLRLADLGHTVILVETPDAAFEAAIKASGRVLRIVDHHLYPDGDGSIIDRSNSRSSLEQIAGILGCLDMLDENGAKLRLDDAHAISFGDIAANDAGYWPGLLRHLITRAGVWREPGKVGFEYGPGALPKTKTKTAAVAAAVEALEDVRDRILVLRSAEVSLRTGRGKLDIAAGRALIDEAYAQLEDSRGGARPCVRECRLPVRPGKTAEPDRRDLLLFKLVEGALPALDDAVYLRAFEQRIAKVKKGEPAYVKILAPKSGKSGRVELDVPALAEPINAVFLNEWKVDGPCISQSRCLSSVFFTGAAPERELVHDLIGGAYACAVDAPQIYAGAGRDAVFMGAQASHAFGDVGVVADAILNAYLTGGRPLEKWRTHFLIALSLEGSEGAERLPALTPLTDKALRKRGRRVCASNQERAYFHDNLRRSILGPETKTAPKTLSDDDRVELHAPEWASFELNTGKSGEPEFLRVGWTKLAQTKPDKPGKSEGAEPPSAGEPLAAPARELIARIRGLRVHFAYNAIVFIECVVEGAPVVTAEGEPLWLQLLESGHGAAAGQVRTMAELLDFNEAARMCYSSYQDMDGDRRITELLGSGEAPFGTNARTVVRAAPPLKPEAPAGWVASMIDYALQPWGKSHADVRLMDDERARVVATACPMGRAPLEPTAAARHEVILARFAGIDAGGDRFAYDADFARTELAQQSYRRYDDQGSFYASSGHSLTLLGYGKWARTKLIDHMSTLYAWQFRVALHYSAVLQSLSRMVTQAAASGDGNYKIVHEARKRMTTFANGVWFENLTPQIQGQELFELILQRLPVRRQYGELTAEIERFDALEAGALADEQAKRAAQDERRGKLLARLGVFGGMLVGLDALGLPLGYALPISIIFVLVFVAFELGKSFLGACEAIWSDIRDALTRLIGSSARAEIVGVLGSYFAGIRTRIAGIFGSKR